VHDEGLDDVGQHHPVRVEKKLFEVRIRDFVVREHVRHSHQGGGADKRGTGFIDACDGTQAMIDLNHDLPPPAIWIAPPASSSGSAIPRQIEAHIRSGDCRMQSEREKSEYGPHVCGGSKS
jgi:hypothetical protein